MPGLSWNEITSRAMQFSRTWQDASRENAEKQTFWNEFFHVFGLERRALATFEEYLSDSGRFIDLFWPNKMLVEHKSLGGDLSAAASQAFNYYHALLRDPQKRDSAPRYIIVSDFARIALYDLEPDPQQELPLFREHRYEIFEFPTSDLHKHIHRFEWIPGYQQHRFQDLDPLNLKAVQIMAELHSVIARSNYPKHDLERFLVRILFCLFAQSTGIFRPQSFRLYIEDHTRSDAYDLGALLQQLFEVLDTPVEQRSNNLDETLREFEYINGDLFKETLRTVSFDRLMREALLKAALFDWSRISPAIFGALFQDVMEETAEERLARGEHTQRRAIGAHYTSERDILKVIHPLFLDQFLADFDHARSLTANRKIAALRALLEKLAKLKFLDPACGCGNFLIIAYREVRMLEMEMLKELKQGQKGFEAEQFRFSQVDVDQFYGIEIVECQPASLKSPCG